MPDSYRCPHCNCYNVNRDEHNQSYCAYGFALTDDDGVRPVNFNQ